MTRRKFTTTFKLEVVRDYYSSGQSYRAVLRKWNINSGSLFQWLKNWPIDSERLSLSDEVIARFRMEHKGSEMTDEEILRKRVSDLERALAYEKLRSRAFEKLIEIAEAEEGLSILKKDGAKQ